MIISDFPISLLFIRTEKKQGLPKCCIVNVRGSDINHLMVYYDGVFYDPVSGETDDYAYETIISFIEVQPA